MLVTEFVEYLQKKTVMKPTSIGYRLRGLRADGVIHSTGRGRSARDIRAAEAAKIIFSIAGSVKIDEAPVQVRELSVARCYMSEGGGIAVPVKPFLGCDTLLELFEHLISERFAYKEISRVLIFPATWSAEVYGPTGKLICEYGQLVPSRDGNSWAILKSVQDLQKSKTSQPCWLIKSDHLKDVRRWVSDEAGSGLAKKAKAAIAENTEKRK